MIGPDAAYDSVMTPAWALKGLGPALAATITEQAHWYKTAHIHGQLHKPSARAVLRRAVAPLVDKVDKRYRSKADIVVCSRAEIDKDREDNKIIRLGCRMQESRVEGSCGERERAGHVSPTLFWWAICVRGGHFSRLRCGVRYYYREARLVCRCRSRIPG